MTGEDKVDQLSQLCHDNNVQLIHKGLGHYHLIKGDTMVNYWPLSSRKTAHVRGETKGVYNVSPEQAVKLALGEKL